MDGVHAPKRLLAGLLVLVFALVIAQAAAAGIPSGKYRYVDGAWLLQQRSHQVAKAKPRQYRYHEGQWILVKPPSSGVR